MDVSEVEARVEQVAAVAGDEVQAHYLEDELWRDVLSAIADGAEHPADLAHAAMKTWDPKRARWYA
jgi:hypothetical protein